MKLKKETGDMKHDDQIQIKKMSYNDINLLADELMSLSFENDDWLQIPDLEPVEDQEPNYKKRKYEDVESPNKKQSINEEIGIFSKYNCYEIFCIGTLHAKYTGTLFNMFAVIDDLSEYGSVPQLTPWLHVNKVSHISAITQLTMILDLIDHMKEDIEEHEFTYDTFKEFVSTHIITEVTWNGKISTFTYIYCVKKGWLTEERCLSSNPEVKFIGW